jgi:hypothetical protein
MEASRACRVPAPSPICTYPERSAIEQQLIAGTPVRDVACQFGVGRMAVQRHAGVHLPEHLMKATDATHAADVGNAGRLLERLGMLHKKTLALLAKAERAIELRTALARVREAANACNWRRRSGARSATSPW